MESSEEGKRKTDNRVLMGFILFFNLFMMLMDKSLIKKRYIYLQLLLFLLHVATEDTKKFHFAYQILLVLFSPASYAPSVSFSSYRCDYYIHSNKRLKTKEKFQY